MNAVTERQSVAPSASKTEAWYAVYTRSRHEQAVERWIARHNVSTYLPKSRVWSARADRRKLIDVPALPGYLFIHCNLTPELRADVKKAPGIVAIVTSNGLPARIPDSQIESLRIVLGSGRHVEPITQFEPGEMLRIRSGPLNGAIGELMRLNPTKNRLVVRIEQIGMAVSVELHEADVEPAK